MKIFTKKFVFIVVLLISQTVLAMESGPVEADRPDWKKTIFKKSFLSGRYNVVEDRYLRKIEIFDTHRDGEKVICEKLPEGKLKDFSCRFVPGKVHGGGHVAISCLGRIGGQEIVKLFDLSSPEKSKFIMKKGNIVLYCYGNRCVTCKNNFRLGSYDRIAGSHRSFEDLKICVFDIPSRKLVVFVDNVCVYKLSLNGRYLATSLFTPLYNFRRKKQNFKVFDLNSENPIEPIFVQKEGLAMFFSPDSRYIAVYNLGDTWEVLDIENNFFKVLTIELASFRGRVKNIFPDSLSDKLPIEYSEKDSALLIAPIFRFLSNRDRDLEKRIQFMQDFPQMQRDAGNGVEEACIRTQGLKDIRVPRFMLEQV